MAPSLPRAIFLAMTACLAAVSANPLPADQAEQQANEQCTSTAMIFPTFTFGPVRTVYTATTTATHLVDCGACDHLALSRVHLGVGPVAFFTTTTTAATPSTTTALKCGKTAEATPAAEQ